MANQISFGVLLCAGVLAGAAAFVDVTAPAGIRFHHDNARSEEKFLVETMGSGVAWIDIDQDGFLDLFFVNGGSTPAYQPKTPPSNALYRSKGDGTFRDVTIKSGLEQNPAFGMGAAVGDFDNDGYPDLYVTGFGASTLYRNQRNGTFADVTRRAAVANSGRWATSAAWFDYDNDGRLDLIVANYLDYDYSRNIWCGDRKPGFRMYCHPQNYEGVAPTLYHNNGDGTFTDATEASGLGREKAKGLGVVAADFDNDGRVDIFLANDSIRNLLYRNKGDGTFEDVTLSSGTGYSEDGLAEAGMGVDAADYNGDGLLDIYVTHLDFELNRLYENRGGMQFADVTMASGLGRSAVLYSGFGTRFADVDADGWPDLVVVNGHVLDNVTLYRPDVRYAEPKLLYRNAGGKFVKSDAAFSRPTVGRGLAVGDFENNGNLSFAISNNGQPGELIRNRRPPGNHWLEIRLIGGASNRDGIGAQVKVKTGSRTLYAQATGGGSYLSSSDPRLYFGLGPVAVAESIEVRWPSGKRDVVRQVKGDRALVIRESP